MRRHVFCLQLATYNVQYYGSASLVLQRIAFDAEAAKPLSLLRFARSTFRSFTTEHVLEETQVPPLPSARPLAPSSRGTHSTLPMVLGPPRAHSASSARDVAVAVRRGDCIIGSDASARCHPDGPRPLGRSAARKGPKARRLVPQRKLEMLTAHSLFRDAEPKALMRLAQSLEVRTRTHASAHERAARTYAVMQVQKYDRFAVLAAAGKKALYAILILNGTCRVEANCVVCA